MKEKIAFLAVCRVSKVSSQLSSVFMLPKELSIGALSQQSPLRGELAAAIGMMHQARFGSAIGDRHFECRDGQFLRHGLTHGPAHDTS